MKLLVRLDSLVHPRTGIGYYTEHLVRRLLSDYPACEVTGLYMGKLVRDQSLMALLDANEGVTRAYVARFGFLGKCLDAIRPWVRAMPGAYAIRQKLHDLSSEKAVKSQHWDLYHEPSFIPLKTRTPIIITIHDLSHIRFPEYHPIERVKFLNKHLGPAIREAAHIITVSEFTKNEVCHFFPDAKGKITAIPLAVDAIFRPRHCEETADTLARWSLQYGHFILSVATQEPRKNLSGLIKAYLELPTEVRIKMPLVLVGGKGWHSSEFQKLVKFAEEQPGRVVVTGRVSRVQLAELMSSCRLFAYPSFYEGFGLPIAEALASGVQVLTSNYGAMREVAGDNAILVNPENFSGDLLEALLSTPKKIDQHYVNDWQNVTRLTRDVYGFVLSRDYGLGTN